MESTTGWKKKEGFGKGGKDGKERDPAKERRADVDECDATRRATEEDYANGSQFDRSALQITAVLTHSTKCTRKTGCLSSIRISRSDA